MPTQPKENGTQKGIQISVRNPGKIINARGEAVSGGDPDEDLPKYRVLDGHLSFGYEEIVRTHFVPGELVPNFRMSCTKENAGPSNQ